MSNIFILLIYYLSAKDSYVTSEAYYGVEFAASIRSGKFLWSSIHPEKSCEVGLKLLTNFCNLC